MAEQIKIANNANTTTSNARGQRLRGLIRNPIFIVVVLVILVGAGFFGFRYWQDTQSKIYIETSEIVAPVISVGPEIPGVLKAVYVKEGDHVVAGQQLFNVGDRITSARTNGIITAVQNTPGQFASNASAIVQMYDQSALRVVGHLQEDQGLSQVKIGQTAIFTIDAFGDKQYTGKVDSIGKNANQGSVVFSISDKRQEKQFDVKIAFDPNAYSEITNGMSARIWVYK